MIAGEYVTDWPVKGSLTPIDIVSDVIGLTEQEIRKTCKVVMIDEPIQEIVNQPSVDTIIATVCNRFKIEPASVQLKTRLREIVEPRQLIFALVMFGLRKGSAETGQQIGNRDHATVLYGISKVSDNYATYADYRKTVNNLIRSLWSDPDQQQYIIDRIIDPHKDRIESQSKFARVASLRGAG